MKHATCCQFCGAQSTTLESYFQWTVCSGCAARLRAPTPDEYLYRSYLSDIDNSTEWVKHRIIKRTPKSIYVERYTFQTQDRKYVIVDRAKLEETGSCYVRSLRDMVYTYQAMQDEIAREEEARREGERLRQQRYEQAERDAEYLRQRFAEYHLSQNTRHARLLAEYAGERLEWPCSAEELKRIWRQAARRTHPDTGGSSEAFRAARASYDALVNLAEVAR